MSALKRTKEEKYSEVQTSLDVHKLGLVKSNRHDLTLQLEIYNDKLNNERGAMKEYMEEKFKEFMTRNPEYYRRLNELDLMFEVENTSLRKMGLYDVDQFQPEIEEAERAKNPQLKGGQTLFSRFKQIIEIELRKRKQQSEVNRQEAIISECQINDEELIRQKEKMEEEEANHNYFLAQEHDNIYIQMRFLKRNVELPLQLSFQVLEKAVLVHVKAISDINEEIKKKGRSKVSNLNEKLKVKNDLDEIKFAVLEKELRIEELILESMGITRLKVTRQLQATISNEKETETEEKNLEEQIKTLKETREKRIKDMEKKEKAMRKEIESIKVQNDTLSNEGAKLLDTVKQRKKIASLMNGAIEEEVEEEMEKEQFDNDDSKKKHLRIHRTEKPKDVQSYEKAMQIAKNRMLFDKAKKLAQEFEILMQELKKLKARTFPQIPSGKNNFV